MRRLLVLALFLPLAATGAVSLSWISTSLLPWRAGEETRKTACRDVRGLNSRQIRYCRRNVDVFPSIATGAMSAFHECQFQFRNRRWNCSLLENHQTGGHGLEDGTREAAFFHAIVSAGVAYGVTKDCAKGLSDRCGCDRSGGGGEIGKRAARNPSEAFQFEGCSENVAYGISVSREFVDASDKSKENGSVTDHSTVNLHNNRAGRGALELAVRLECKCHGVSGSCELRTCWNAVPPFREIGEMMKDKFDGAAEVIVAKDEEEKKPRIVMKHSHIKRHTAPSDLVYLVQSPDYCDMDDAKGIVGTRGRRCNPASLGTDGCQLMCCNRGFHTIERTVNEKCHCKFVYCCRVECLTCPTHIVEHFCN